MIDNLSYILCEEGETPLTQLILDNNIEKLKVLLKFMKDSFPFTIRCKDDGSEPEAKRGCNFLHEKNDNGFYPLNVAIAADNDVAVDLLIEAGADVNKVICHGTAVHQCAAMRKEMFLQKLIKAGANIEAVDHRDLTPIFFTVFSGDENMTKAFIKAGADINYVAKNEDCPGTVLDYSIMLERPKVTQVLKSAGALTYEELLERKEISRLLSLLPDCPPIKIPPFIDVEDFICKDTFRLLPLKITPMDD